MNFVSSYFYSSDPFCPLWVKPFMGTTYGLDWLPDPRYRLTIPGANPNSLCIIYMSCQPFCSASRCVYGAMEDETMWLLSLERATHDIPLTGNYHNVASKHEFHSFHCSTFAIWSLQASRFTGFFFT